MRHINGVCCWFLPFWISCKFSYHCRFCLCPSLLLLFTRRILNLLQWLLLWFFCDANQDQFIIIKVIGSLSSNLSSSLSLILFYSDHCFSSYYCWIYLFCLINLIGCLDSRRITTTSCCFLDAYFYLWIVETDLVTNVDHVVVVLCSCHLGPRIVFLILLPVFVFELDLAHWDRC